MKERLVYVLGAGFWFKLVLMQPNVQNVVLFVILLLAATIPEEWLTTWRKVNDNMYVSVTWEEALSCWFTK